MKHGLSIAAVIAECAALPIMRLDSDPADEARFDALCDSRQYRIAKLRDLRQALADPPPYRRHGRPSLEGYKWAIRQQIKAERTALKTARDIGPRTR
jgi:hypothetical protein